MTIIEREAPERAWSGDRYIHWSPVIAGALAAAALSFIFLSFGGTIGLAVSSTAPTWRDASLGLWLLSGLYLILAAMISFAVGGYVAGRTRAPEAALQSDTQDMRDGAQGVASWALAVVIGAVLVAMMSGSGPSTTSNPSLSTAAENTISFELDRLYRAPRRAANVDVSQERAEAGRILLAAGSRRGLAVEDRSYLIQQVGALTGLQPADAERRVDVVVERAREAISYSRRSAVILAFSAAVALLLGAVVAWFAACAGGRHRDGAPLPDWMTHSERFERAPKRVV